MYMKPRRQFLPVASIVALAAIVLGIALLPFGSQSGQAAVRSIADSGLTGASNAAICVVDQATTFPFLEAELVETGDCPGDDDGDVLATTTGWIELDFSDNRIRSTFAPGRSELDGLLRGARIDLRGTGVNQNEIDLSEAISNEGPLYDALVKVAPANAPLSDVTGYPPTFLLDGGGDETGLGNLPTSIDEGGILYIPFHFGERPRGLNIPVKRGVSCSGDPPDVTCSQDPNTQVDSLNPIPAFDGSRGNGDSVERFVAIEISVTHKGLDFERTVYVMASSRDPDDTLYVVPVLMGNDSVIDDNENAEIKVEGVKIGQRQDGDLMTPMVGRGDTRETATGFDLAFLYERGAILDGYDDDFEDVLSTAQDTVLVEDNDSSRYPVCERHPQVIAAIESALNGEKCRRISLDSLGMIDELSVYPGAPDVDDPLEEIYYSDLEGLTGLIFLDLGGNELRDLPANAFRDVGVGKPREIALIDMRFNLGRRRASDGFLASDLSSSVRSNLQHLQVIRLDNERDGEVGFDRSAYSVYESDVLTFQVRVNSGVPYIELDLDDETTTSTDEDLPLLPGNSQTILNLADANVGAGTYVIAMKMPFTGDEDRVNEKFAMTLRGGPGGDPVGEVATVTIRDVTRERTRNISTSSRVYQPPRRPTPRPDPVDRPSFDYPAFVIDNQYEVDLNNPDLRHNIPDLSVTIDGRTVVAGFLSHYRNTGGRERWGYPTSEVLVLEDGTLTQFYQRGAVDFHNIVGWVVERRLAWDYVGGGEGGSIDQEFESGPFNPNPGIPLGPWGNRVSNVSIEGTYVGFADFFEEHGSVGAFGVPKTEARTDIRSSGRLLGPEQTPGFIRQYFQAAIFEFHPNDPIEPVKLALLGDTLRDLLVPNHQRERAFAAAGILIDGASYVPPVVD